MPEGNILTMNLVIISTRSWSLEFKYYFRKRL